MTHACLLLCLPIAICALCRRKFAEQGCFFQRVVWGGVTMSYLNSRMFNAEDFTVSDADFIKLDATRPFGLSGHLRVRNEALTLRACLDSCLPFLDELIVTYNDSHDATEEILLEYARRNPKKIRLFWYPLEWGAIMGKVHARPLGHLAQFYNFGYTKVRYSHYMKIDGDQVYFTPKMLFIKKMLKKYSDPKLHAQDIPILHNKQSTIFEICERNIARSLIEPKKYTPVLGGVNMCYFNDDLYLMTFENLEEKTLFNGFSGDTFIVSPNSKQRYTLSGERMEAFPHLNSQCISLGLCWIHGHAIKKNSYYSKGPIIPLKEAHAFSWDDVYEKINTRPTTNTRVHNRFNNFGRRFWDRDIPTFLTKDFCRLFLDDVLTLVQKQHGKNT